MPQMHTDRASPGRQWQHKTTASFSLACSRCSGKYKGSSACRSCMLPMVNKNLHSKTCLIQCSLTGLLVSFVFRAQISQKLMSAYFVGKT